MTVMGDLIRRMGLVSSLLLTLLFAMPAFATHACEPGATSPRIEASIGQSAGEAGHCRDCGPACAHGCCYVAHALLRPEAAVAPAPLALARPSAWRHAEAGPLYQPSGPERPPRA